MTYNAKTEIYSLIFKKKKKCTYGFQAIWLVLLENNPIFKPVYSKSCRQLSLSCVPSQSNPAGSKKYAVFTSSDVLMAIAKPT